MPILKKQNQGFSLSCFGFDAAEKRRRNKLATLPMNGPNPAPFPVYILQITRDEALEFQEPIRNIKDAPKTEMPMSQNLMNGKSDPSLICDFDLAHWHFSLLERP